MHYVVENVATARFFRARRVIGELFRLNNSTLLNSLDKKKERLIEITADAVIEDSELQDFVRIQKELEAISASADSLRLWIDNKILS